MSIRKNYKSRPGAVLLAVLIIIMVITVLSLGFIARSDMELACGRNMVLREQMDYLAESGLEQAKGLILNPQDVEDDYYVGASGLQLVGGSENYYDISVLQDSADHCNYTIDCNAYEMRDGEKAGQSNLRALLRLDPCIALWSGDNLAFSNTITVNGDVYCDGDISGMVSIGGDLFSQNTSDTGLDISGQLSATSELSLVWPQLSVDGYASKTGVTYHSSDYTLSSDIEGMLLVDGDLFIDGGSNLTINATKNLPALYVTGNLCLVNNSTLNINGLAVVDGHVFLDSATQINEVGGLFAKQGVFEVARDSSGNADETVASLYNGAQRSIGYDGIHGALKLDGLDDYAKAENESIFDIENAITVAAWIYVDSFDEEFQAIVTKGDNAWRLQRYSNTNKIEFACTGISNNSYGNVISNTELIENSWYHVVGVYDGTKIYIYIELSLDNWEYATGSINTNDCDVLIGKNAEQPNRNWNGCIDNLQIYNRALDLTEIIPLYIGNSTTGLVANWKFDETDSDISITAAPEKSAIIIYDNIGIETRWGQAAGAFYKSIERR